MSVILGSLALLSLRLTGVRFVKGGRRAEEGWPVGRVRGLERGKREVVRGGMGVGDSLGR